ncbi:histidine phosphatase family protein [Fodinibius salsisoli]|uniref:Histidine phosphatase family protein n=1 Tax=Fodinibius salsisoli TaxID=2820877 RepID=A0ABT3PSM5_9BACT|nr:histidine phosphatase family protein [Fodinibius salsisoli]MCW9708858.1 histidine phosphatase family protein [Fodinibius salsisoli]
MTNLYLARHGETEYNRRSQMQGRGIDAPLNETGREQAKAIATHAKSLDLHHIYSSSLKRSRQTAEFVGQDCGLDVQSYSELDEMDFGEFEGKRASEIKTELQTLHTNWKSGNVTFAASGGESPQMVLDRAATKAEQIMAEHHTSNLLFVLHGRLIRILLSHWLGLGLSAMHHIEHSNGALYHLRWDGEHYNSVYLHNTDHLQNGALS